MPFEGGFQNSISHVGIRRRSTVNVAMTPNDGNLEKRGFSRNPLDAPFILSDANRAGSQIFPRRSIVRNAERIVTRTVMYFRWPKVCPRRKMILDTRRRGGCTRSRRLQLSAEG